MSYELSYPTDAAEDGDWTFTVDPAMSTTTAHVGTVGWPAGAENLEGTPKTDSITSAYLVLLSDNRRDLSSPVVEVVGFPPVD
jgi:hypothetical protein